MAGEQNLAPYEPVNTNTIQHYIANEIAKRRRRSLHARQRWSFGTHGATVLIVVFSATSAVLSQVGVDFWIASKNWATILSLLVTIISTVQSRLGFEKKWIANRMTHSALSQLEIDLKTGTPPAELAAKLKQIVQKHDEAITS